MSDLVLALDIGTTSVRALVFDSSSAVRGAFREEFRPRYPRPAWVEIDPAEMWEAVLRVWHGALAAAGVAPQDLAAAGIANQRATVVAWDAHTGEPLYPAIVWQDLRTAKRVNELLAQGVFANTMASSTKMEWLLREVEEVRQEVASGHARFGTVDSWIAWKLSGGRAHVTDHSNASCTGLYDFASGRWDEAQLEFFGIPAAALAEVLDSSGVRTLTDPATAGARVPIAAIAGDQQAAAFGHLRLHKGEMKITLGTSAMADVNTGDALVPPPAGTYPLVLWSLQGQRSFCLEGAVMTAGSAVQWLRDGMGALPSLEEACSLPHTVSDTGGVWAIPALQGLGTPHMAPSARALIGGLSRGSTRAHVVRAMLEGIAFRCSEVVSTLAAAVGQPEASPVRVDGGAAINDFLVQMIANAVGSPVERPATLQATALGVAYLAGLATGVWGDIEQLRDSWCLGVRMQPLWSADERRERLREWQARVELALAAASRLGSTEAL